MGRIVFDSPLSGVDCEYCNRSNIFHRGLYCAPKTRCRRRDLFCARFSSSFDETVVEPVATDGPEETYPSTSVRSDGEVACYSSRIRDRTAGAEICQRRHVHCAREQCSERRRKGTF